MAAIHTYAAASIRHVVRDLLDVWQIPDPWPTSPPVVEDFIYDGVENSDLNFVNIGPPWRFFPLDARLMPALIIDVTNIDVSSERGGSDSPEKLYKHTLTIPVYYLMSRSEATDYDAGDILSSAEILAVERLGRLRGTIIKDAVAKDFDGVTTFSTDCSDPVVDNEMTTETEGTNIGVVAASMVVMGWVAEDAEL